MRRCSRLYSSSARGDMALPTVPPTINKPPAMIDPLPIGVEDGIYNSQPLMILPFEPRAGEAPFTQLFEVPLSFFGFRDRRKDNRAFPLRAGCRFNAVGTRVSHF